MSRRSIPEIRAAAARQAEIVRQLAAEVALRDRRRRQIEMSAEGGFAHFITNLTSRRAGLERAFWR